MDVYQTDRDGWFVGVTQAFESPLEPGVIHLPAGCTEDQPPVSIGLTPRLVAGSWSLQLKPADPEPISPVDRLAEFLRQHPDVADLINTPRSS